jgi:hypothetical protein
MEQMRKYHDGFKLEWHASKRSEKVQDVVKTYQGHARSQCEDKVGNTGS